MGLTEITKVDLIEITENNNIQVRTATIILKDDVEITRTFHRHVLSQGDDITNEDSKVIAIANAIWV
jgi:urease accessory protein UreE